MSMGALRQSLGKLLMVVVLLMTTGCTTRIAARYPHLGRRSVCVLPPKLEPDTRDFIFDEANEPISNLQEDQIERAAPMARTVFEYDPNANPRSTRYLPAPYDQLQCPTHTSFLPWREEEVSPLPESSFDLYVQHSEGQEDCPKEWLPAGVLGQTLPKKYLTGGCMAPRPLTAKEQAKNAARRQSKAIGRQLGEFLSDATETPDKLLFGPQRAALRKQWRDPLVLERDHKALAEKLNAIPDLPTFEDPELARAALEGFEEGFGSGVNAARTKALAVLIASEAALTLSGSVAALVESAGTKALTFAVARLRTMPVFVPGTTNGIGFFLRIPKALPKPPPANVNAPSLPPGVAAPPIAAPPPFGSLSRAAEFGVKPYNQLVKAVQGTGLEGHHLIEQRFIHAMKGDPRMNLAVAVTEAEHQAFTNEWRRFIGYGNAGTYTAKPDQILDAARRVYKDYPTILKAPGL